MTACSAPPPSTQTDTHTYSRTLIYTHSCAAATYRKVFRDGGSKQLPVLPSDHYGLLVEFEPK